MKIDLKQLQRIERSYLHDEVTLSSLKQMIINVLNYNESSYKTAPNNITIAIETLSELKIIISDDEYTPPIQPLNS
jgi:hypothetical protein